MTASRVHSMHLLDTDEQDKWKLRSLSVGRASMRCAIHADAMVPNRTSTTQFPASRFCPAGAKLVLRSCLRARIFEAREKQIEKRQMLE